MIGAAGLRGAGREARWKRRRLRHWSAAALALVALWSLWATLRPAPAAQRRVIVADRELAAGHRITAADLQTVTWPASLKMPTTADSSALLGRRVTSTIAAGEPVTVRRVDGRLTTALGADRVAFVVPLTDGSLLSYLQPGDTVDLFGAGPSSHSVTGAHVMSVTVATPDAASPASVMVSVPRSQSAQLAALLTTAAASGTAVVAALHGSA
ncbi:SAF domain-containing protein [Calidifontibacter terrae]